jgi:hypothetical protein
MKKNLSSVLALGTVTVAVTGCAIHQKVKPIEQATGSQICIIENSAVRAGFLDSYKRALATKGYSVRQLPPSAGIGDCPTTSTYTANWRWDLAIYMAFAEITVYHQGKRIGDATYDAQGGGANMGKFIDADKKIGELVNQLFRGGAGT